MAAYSFHTGATVLIRGVHYEVANKLADGRIQFRQPETSELAILSREELLALYEHNELEFELRGLPTSSGAHWYDNLGKIAFAALTEQERLPAERKERYVKAVLAAGVKHLTKELLTPIIRKCASDESIPDKNPPSWISVYRWIKRYTASGCDIRSLLAYRANQGNVTPRINGRIRELAIQALDEIYLTLERPTLKEARFGLEHILDLENKQRAPSQKLTCPSTKYLSKVLHEQWDEYTITKRRYGSLAAERDFRGSTGRKERPTRPMERVELDHTLLDVIVVDDETFVLLGRPLIAFAADVLTRCIAGISLGFEHPSASTLTACIKHAILPKTYVKSMYPNINNSWDCMGNIETLVLDRALENLGRRIAAASRQNGIDIEYNKRRSGWGKGIVERINRTCNEGVIHLMPGTTFSNILARGDYQSSKYAIITLSALREILHKWIIDVYHQTFHRGIHDTPAHKWQIEVAATQIYLPRTARDLEIAFGTPELGKTLWHYGVEINGLRYNNDLMLELRRKIGNRPLVDIMWYGENLGYIDVLDPTTNEYIRVHCIDFEYASGMTLYQHKINRAYAKEHYEGREDITALAAAKAEIRQMIKQTISKKRGTTRKRQARYMDGRGFEYPQDVPTATAGTHSHENTTSDNPMASCAQSKVPNSKSRKQQQGTADLKEGIATDDDYYDFPLEQTTID